MNSKTKNCQNCQKDFVIEPDDFLFYERMKIPPPTFCPECRMIRRMACRNIRNFYKDKCDADGHQENIVSMYSSDKPNKVYDSEYWWSDNWDPLDYGRDYDFSKSFFIQFAKLFDDVPQMNFTNVMPINSDYCNTTIRSKNCHFLLSGNENENCIFSECLMKCRDCCDVLVANQSEFCYESIDCNFCFKVTFSQNCEQCVNSSFLYDCHNCQNCFGCWNLRSKTYYIFNKQYTKEEYNKTIQNLFSGKYSDLVEVWNKLKIVMNPITKYSQIFHSNDVIGNGIANSKNCFNCFDVRNFENSKYIWRILGGGAENYDVTIAVKPELGYEGNGIGYSYKSLMCLGIDQGKDLIYCQYCLSNCSDCFGCVGLRGKHYCIFNKQYTKEEYFPLVEKIKQQMDDMPYVDNKGKIYKYGEFNPIELSPFGYNETIAQEYFPLTKEEALAKGYKWKDKEERNYKIDIKPDDLPDNIYDVNEDILNKIIGCSHYINNEHPSNCGASCTDAFRITSEELQFYKHMNLPLPHLCPNCRHYGRLLKRNPVKLWHRKCMKEGCNNEFETPYAPNRLEIIYCEKCYQNEVC